MSATQSNDSSKSRAVLYLAFELGEATWKLGSTMGLGQKPREWEMPSRAVVVLEKEIQAAKERFGLPEDALVVSCYEAGRDGFWLHRYLLSKGLENIIVDSSSIQVDRRQRRAKTDRLDVRKLLKMLVRWQQGEKDVWGVVRVPTMEEEDARQLHRELETLKEEQTSHSNRIKGLLSSCGVVMEVEIPPSGTVVGRLRGAGGFAAAIVAGVHPHARREPSDPRPGEGRGRRLRQDEEDQGVQKTRELLRLMGIGVNSSWLFVREIFGWRKIKNRREIRALVGLTGSPYQSGSLDHEQGISKAANRRMRAMAVEIAWCWL